jgi:hypothetical protein
MTTKGRTDLHVIMEHATPERTLDNLQMWACRNTLPTCPKHLRTGKHCDSCVLGLEDETLDELIARMTRGNA